MSKDNASFRQADVEACYGNRPRCILSGTWQWVDGHHVLGRGELFGIKPGDRRRWLLSSIFNFAPIHRDIHNFGTKDHPELRHFFLRMARERVAEAHHKGSYQITALDKEFLALAADWMLDNPVL